MIRSAAEVKLAHAADRLGELERAIDGFVATSPFTIDCYLSDDRRSHSNELRVKVLPPDHRLGPLIGDVIHNIGSSLDAIAWHAALACARVAGGQPVHGVRFPAVSTDTPTSRRKLAEFLRPFEPIPPIRDFIELVQPREDAGCQELVILEALWNHDKHRGIHRTIPVQVHNDGRSWSSFTGMPLDTEAPITVPAASGSSAAPLPDTWTPSWPVRDPWTLGFAPPSGATLMDSPAYVGSMVVPTLRAIHLAVRSRVVRPLSKIVDSTQDEA